MWKVGRSLTARFSYAKSLQALGGRRSNQTATTGVPTKKYEKVLRESSERSLPTEADVVIVGGGAAGCSTLYHLAKLGITNTVLLEMHSLTAGTSWHTAGKLNLTHFFERRGKFKRFVWENTGLVWNLRPNDVEVELLVRSRKLMASLEAETGIDPGWINNGGLFVASTNERMDEYKRLMTLGRAFGVESEVLSPKETKKLYPLMNVDDVYATLYSPADGTIEPAGYCSALTRAAAKAGARVVEGCSLTAIETVVDDYGTRRVHAVQTNKGRIRTNCVVNCAGVWAPSVGEMVDVTVPLVAMKHAYVVTEKIEGIRQMPNVRDHDFSVYFKLQGDALCIGGYEPNPHFVDKVDDDFAFSLYELDWDIFTYNTEGHVKRIPVIESTGIKSTVCGPESFTADHKPLMGESDQVRGFFLNCGYNSAGLMLSGGCGEQMAKWVVKGRPELEMHGFDIRRFNAELTRNARWNKERSHEAYAKNYSIVFPHDEALAGRNMRKDPLYEVLLNNGCVYQERLGWERPGWFDIDGKPSPVLKYDYYGSYGNKLHENYDYKDKLMYDYTFDFPNHHEIIGRECRTVYTCMLNNRGGVESDLTVSIIEDHHRSLFDPVTQDGRIFYVAIGGGVAQAGLSHIKSILQDKKLDCQLIDATNDLTLLSVQGPNSRDIMEKVCEDDVDFSNEAFPFGTHKVVNVAGHQCRVIRLSFVGELGWEIHAPSSTCPHVYKALREVGKEMGLLDAGYRAIDSLSIEKGYHHSHADLRSDYTALEAGLRFACKLKSDVEFVGRERLERQIEGRERILGRLTCFTTDKKIPLHGLEAIYRNDKVVGFLCRADYGFFLKKTIGYGYVSGETIDEKYLTDADYTIEHLGKRYKADLHLRSPFDPANNRIRGIY
ncbi:DgyrCDS11326 [Dimorphilus gyrociliatus]|uniref:DgyrCDS11326 n=1 Tax=Dimorphilus gyrociliatus TaxID=2664684 RepID=A0A7I8W2Y2_9ANNE|nr:DgyrCDS11326 [Dimorphilus gyrociliatus]